MKRIVLALGVAGLVGLIGFRLYESWPHEEGGPGDGPPPSFGRAVRVARAELGPVSESVTLVGSLRAEETVNVTPRINGRVVEVLVDIGDRVLRGDVLARLEDDEFRQQEQQAEASLEVARAVVNQRQLELRNLQAILDRNRELREDGLISTEELEQAQTRFDVGQAQLNLARAQLLQSEAGLRELQIRLDQTRVVAPISGLVGRRFVDVGALVNANTPVVTLVNLSTVELVANVPERDMVRLEPGAEGTVYVDALPGEVFTGRVARISPLLDAQTRTAQVEIVVPNDNGHLRAEMFARVELELGTERTVLRVPRDALVLRGERRGVYVLEQETARFREIEVGMSGGDWIEVDDGLTEGEMVATMGANLLRDGDRVEVTASADPEGTSP